MSTLARHFSAAEDQIRDICLVSGIPGVSAPTELTIRGRIFMGNFGYRDVEQKLPTTENTVYHIWSLTKLFTAIASGVLIQEEEKLNWNTPVKSYLPQFRTLDCKTVGNKATMIDLLSYRTGLAQKLDIWLQGGNQLLLPKSETISTVVYLEQAKPFRSQ